jgi:hypothetical protein
MIVRATGFVLFSPPHPGFSASANIALSGLKIPCGRCIGCRLEYSRQWAMRCHHEASDGFYRHIHRNERTEFSKDKSSCATAS